MKTMQKKFGVALLLALLAAPMHGVARAQASAAHTAAAPVKTESLHTSAPAEPQNLHISAPAEPQNLGLLKTKLKAYAKCCYAQALEKQDEVAERFLERAVKNHPSTQGPRAGGPGNKQAKPGEKLALVLDIDETSLSNYPEMAADDYGFIAKDWDAWADEAKAAAIPGTLKLAEKAQALGVTVFFITGRADTLRAATEKNLREAGYANWAGLTMRAPDQLHEATIAYKSAAREAIVKQGYRIILSVGDQWSDLKGTPQAEYSVKLPNPFYYIP